MANISSSCQFVGANDVLKAYTRRGVPSWAIWHNKQFMFKCECADIAEGEQILAEHLEALRNSVATYTLCVYEDIKDGMKIKSKTENDGSFNFQLTPKGSSGEYDNSLLREIRQSQIEQELRLAKLEDEEEEQEVSGVGNIIGTIKEVMSIPGIGDLIAGLFSRGSAPVQMAGIGYVPEQKNNIMEPSFQNNYAGDQNNVVEITEAEAEKLGSAYATIKSKMPECLQLLESLADMAINNPNKFETVRGLIKTFML